MCVCVRYVCVLITLYLRFNGYLRGPVYSSSKIVDNFSIETETNNTAPKPEFYDHVIKKIIINILEKLIFLIIFFLILIKYAILRYVFRN